MARIIYQDETVTEYDDGTEEAHFTEEEWVYMAAHPAAFGLACALHGTEDWLRDHQLCLVCEVGPPDHHEEGSL